MGTSAARISEAVERIECSSWEDFKLALHDDYAEDPGATPPLYRGQARPYWKLQSPWERQFDKKTTNAGRRDLRARLLVELLANFRDLSIGLPGVHSREIVNDDDWWALGRHYGLTTPLLDWTKSPYVAAFFAFTDFLEQVSPGVTRAGALDARRVLSKESTERIAIWSFLAERISEAPGLPPGLEIVHTRPDVAYRQRAQRGVFTRLQHESHNCLEEFISSFAPRRPPLRQYLIPGWEAPRAITELRMMNITFATLFPDLTGAALQANFEMVSVALLIFAAISSETWKSLADLPPESAI